MTTEAGVTLLQMPDKIVHFRLSANHLTSTNKVDIVAVAPSSYVMSTRRWRSLQQEIVDQCGETPVVPVQFLNKTNSLEYGVLRGRKR